MQNLIQYSNTVDSRLSRLARETEIRVNFISMNWSKETYRIFYKKSREFLK